MTVVRSLTSISSNEQLNAAPAKTTASPAEVDKAVVIYEDARLRPLKITMLVLAGLALLAVIPSGRMPGFSTEELPVGYPKDEDAIYDLGEADDTAVI